MYKINGHTVQHGIRFVGEHEKWDGFLEVAAHPDLTDGRHPPPAVRTATSIRRQEFKAPVQVPESNRANATRRKENVKLFACCVLYIA